MPAPVPRPRPGPAERALAWLFTGPLGHLYSTVADLAEFFVGSVLERARRRVRRRP